MEKAQSTTEVTSVKFITEHPPLAKKSMKLVIFAEENVP